MSLWDCFVDFDSICPSLSFHRFPEFSFVALYRRRDFERHPAMAELSDPSGRFIKGLEKDLNEDARGTPEREWTEWTSKQAQSKMNQHANGTWYFHDFLLQSPGAWREIIFAAAT